MKTLFSFTKNIENIRSNLYGYQSNRFISRELIKKKFPSIEKPSLLSTNMIQSNSSYIYIYTHIRVHDKYAGHACFGSDICFRIKCSPRRWLRKTLFRSLKLRHPSIHDTWSAHSSAGIRWHDTRPATVPWNHASWSGDPPSFVTLPSPPISALFASTFALFTDPKPPLSSHTSSSTLSPRCGNWLGG